MREILADSRTMMVRLWVLTGKEGWVFEVSFDHFRLMGARTSPANPDFSVFFLIDWFVLTSEIWDHLPFPLFCFSYYLSYSFSSIGFFSSNHSIFCGSVLSFFSLHTQPHAPWLTSSICPVLATTYIQLPNGHPPLDRKWALQWQTAPRAKHYLFA